MKKYIIGVIIGAGFMVGGYAMAATAGVSGLRIVDQLNVGYGNYFEVQKIYDIDTKTICYVVTGGPSGSGISCLKNI